VSPKFLGDANKKMPIASLKYRQELSHPNVKTRHRLSRDGKVWDVVAIEIEKVCVKERRALFSVYVIVFRVKVVKVFKLNV